MKKFHLIGALIFSLSVNFSYSQSSSDINYYNFYPTSALQLGKGFVKNDFTWTGRDAFETVELDVTTDNSISSILGLSVIYDEKTLKNKFHLDTKIEARTMVFKGSASFDYDFSSAFESNSLNILLEASSEFGQIKLKSPTLNDEAKSLLSLGTTGYDQFKNNYGTHYVNGIRRGVNIYVVITIRSISRDLQNKIGLKTSGELDLTAYSGSFKLDISKELITATKENRLDIKVLAKGGKGIADLQDVVKNLTFQKDNLDKIMSAIGDYVSKLDYTASVPIGYFTAPYSQFGLDYYDIFTYERERILEEIRNEYNRLLIINSNLENLADENNFRNLLVTKEHETQIKKHSGLIKERLSLLAQLHGLTLKETDLTKIKIPNKLEINQKQLIPNLPNYYAIIDWANYEYPRADHHHAGSTFGFTYGFDIISDENIPSHLKLIDNIQFTANDEVFFDYKKETNERVGNKISVKNINSVFAARFTSDKLKSKLIEFENKVYNEMKSTGEYGRDLDYYLLITDVFGRVFKQKYCTASYIYRDDYNRSVTTVMKNSIEFFRLPYQPAKVYISLPPYYQPTNLDTLYLFKQPLFEESSKESNAKNYYSIKYPQHFYVLLGYELKPFGHMSRDMKNLKWRGEILELFPLDKPLKGIRYYWSTSDKIIYDETTGEVVDFDGYFDLEYSGIILDIKELKLDIETN